MKKIIRIIISLLIPQLAGAAGAIFTAQSVGGWYQTIEKGPLNPPSWIFGPVWMLLFLLMGYALYLIWEEDSRKKITKKWWAYYSFALQLLLNILWSILFFGMQNSELAFFEILILLLAIAFNIFTFKKVSHTAAWLLAPYLVWVVFATYLNFSIWRLN